MLALPIGCGDADPEDTPPPPLTVVHITENVTVPTTWTAANLYVVDASVTITATLTIEPGTIIKLEDGESISVDANGALVAAGNEATPCVFTSVKDDAHGGDTNGDAGASSPADGDWAGIDICQGGPCFFADWGNILYAANP